MKGTIQIFISVFFVINVAKLSSFFYIDMLNYGGKINIIIYIKLYSFSLYFFGAVKFENHFYKKNDHETF